ncbi:MAG: hypothetical protein QGH11_14325 [Pirellulaceae bacterium]|jgi:hypothetical protein|nr:hypothetical protein [Pirellulaceae bacterium]
MADLEKATRAGHETTDAQAGGLARVAIVIAVFLTLVFFGIVILFKVFAYYQPLLHSQAHPLAETRVETSTEPRVEVDPPRVKIDLDRIEEHVLTTYDWVDEEAGLVRIPIDRAIVLLAQRGL